MKITVTTTKTLAAILLFFGASQLFAQHHSQEDPELHVNSKWSECSFQLDPGLTQEAWREFTQEAGLVGYFRPLVDAGPMGKRNFEVSLLQWRTAFDDTKPAWNDTFVQPDSTHWLKQSSRLAFPGITARAGVTDKLDVALYFTKNPGANYGFVGGQVQYNLVNETERKWSAAIRASAMSMFGPEDLELSIYGADAIVSKEFSLYTNRISISPYAGLSTYMAATRETTDAVALSNEHAIGGQFMIGAQAKIYAARLGVEYNIARLSTLSFKMGIAF